MRPRRGAEQSSRRLRATAGDCGQLRATAGDCGRLRATAGDCGRLRALVDLLTRDSEPARLAAATALGHVGSVRAIARLHALCEGREGSRALRAAARASIESIQASLGAVEAGRLSLADDLQGRVSVVNQRATKP